ncbi:MAG: spore gernimation protein GerA [Paenibacillus sp.]|jgi:hypothetical protein|nr:spore gernimation protein GerA [Paenibacillus sp.]
MKKAKPLIMPKTDANMDANTGTTTGATTAANTGAGSDWTEEKLLALFEQCDDVKAESHQISDDDSESRILFMYAEGLCDNRKIAQIVLPELVDMYAVNRLEPLKRGHPSGKLPLVPCKPDSTSQDMMDAVFQGELIIVFEATNIVFLMNLSDRPERNPQESSTEISIKGPKDGFVENISVNIALIRKRIRSNSLCCETYTLGARTRTKVGLMYINDILSPKILQEVRTRLQKIDVDGVYSIAQMEEWLSDSKYTLFPLLDFTGRPDYTVTSLLAGRFIIIVDGNPLVLVGPASFALLLKSPEDVHFNYIYISFARVVRFISFWLSVLLPGLWVALTAFHQDQIPFRLLATISIARIGLPLSAQMEMFTLLLLLEIFREAGVRLPSSIGQTLTVIGGLVIGDAAIRAGLVSPSVVVIGAVTAVMGATLVNQTLSTGLSVIRFVIFLISAVMGMYGLILGTILLIFYMSKLKSFGLPFFAPLSPFIGRDVVPAYLRLPWEKLRKRPSGIDPVDPDHFGDNAHE